jgi:vacuolar-type H+-ATPase subunit D/Vma8
LIFVFRSTGICKGNECIKYEEKKTSAVVSDFSVEIASSNISGVVIPSIKEEFNGNSSIMHFFKPSKSTESHWDWEGTNSLLGIIERASFFNL